MSTGINDQTDINSICLSCTLPDCNDKHPDCPFRIIPLSKEYFYAYVRRDYVKEKERQRSKKRNKTFKRKLWMKKYMQQYRSKNKDKINANKRKIIRKMGEENIICNIE